MSKTFALSLCLLFLFIRPMAKPQASTSSVRGTVRDQSNAVIVGAFATLVNSATNVTSKTTTSEIGFYVFPGLPPGAYRLAIESPGMQKFEGELTVQVQQEVVVDAVLKVGQTASEVSVKDITPLLTVDSPTLGSVLERQRIEELPINGRFVTSLLQTIPGMEGTQAFGEQRGTLEWVSDGAVISDRFQDVVRRPPGLVCVDKTISRPEINDLRARRGSPTEPRYVMLKR